MDYFAMRDKLAESAGIAGLMDSITRNVVGKSAEVKTAYKVIYDEHLSRLLAEVEKVKKMLDESIAVRSSWSP